MIAVAASASVPKTSEVVAQLAVLLSASDDEVVIVRCDKAGAISSVVEQVVADIAEQIGKAVLKMPPDESKRGRLQTFERDRHIIAVADHLISFFIEGEEMEGGTGNLTRMALEGHHTSVEAYIVDSWGVPHLVGHDPADPRVTMGRWTNNEALAAMWKEASEHPY